MDRKCYKAALQLNGRENGMRSACICWCVLVKPAIGAVKRCIMQFTYGTRGRERVLCSKFDAVKVYQFAPFD